MKTYRSKRLLNPDHHLDLSRQYLGYVSGDISAGDYAKAARALARSASHAVTAAAVHWHHRHHSRRRLNVVVAELAFDRRIRRTHVRTFVEVYRTADQITHEPPAIASRMLRRMRRRVSRLIAAITAAIALQPDVPTLEQIVADPTALPAPLSSPKITTIGELRDALGQAVDTDHRNHPIDCPGCRINYHGPRPAHTV